MVEKVEGLRRGQPLRAQQFSHDVDVEAIAALVRLDGGANRHRPLRIEVGDATVERALVAFNVMTDGFVAVTSNLMFTWWKLNADGGFGQEDFAERGVLPQ